MNLYLISQTRNSGWDTYDSAVVVAKSEDEARKIHPHGGMNTDACDCGWDYGWAPVSVVSAELIGVANDSYAEGDVVCASFNAG